MCKRGSAGRKRGEEEDKKERGSQRVKIRSRQRVGGNRQNRRKEVRKSVKEGKSFFEDENSGR